MSESVLLRIPGTAMSQIEGSELYQNWEKYDPDDPNVILAWQALHLARRERRGKGVSYVLSAVPAAAEIIWEYLATQADIHLGGMSDPELRADGRVYAKTAANIRAAMVKEWPELFSDKK